MSKEELLEVILPTVRGFRVGEKKQKQITEKLVHCLILSGYDVDEQDSREILKPGLPAWRSKHDNLIVETSRRRKIDLVVYRQDRLQALVEVESDLNDLRESGVSMRGYPNNYDVFSIARNAGGDWFNSYHSLERMAVAAMRLAQSMSAETRHSNSDLISRLERLSSDSPEDHNPLGIPIILVSVKCRSMDKRILLPRLKSLNAILLCTAIR